VVQQAAVKPAVPQVVPDVYANVARTAEFDGKWVGTGTLVPGTGISSDCWPQDYTLNIADGVITGTLVHQNRGQRMTSDISGVIASDGAAALEMKRSFPPRRSSAVGVFTKEGFKATDRGGGQCLYEVVLKRG